MKTFCLTILLIFGGLLSAFTQQIPIRATQATNDSVFHQYDPVLTPVNTVTGQLTYLWWFGDNYFSFAEKPTHQYRSHPANHDLHVVITENYSNSGPPPAMRITDNPVGAVYGLSASGISPLQSNETKLLKQTERMRLQHYRQAVPNDTMYLIVTYESDTSIHVPERQIKLLFDSDYESFFSTYSNTPNSFRPNGEVILDPDALLWSANLDQDERDQSILIPIKVSDQLTEHLYDTVGIRVVMIQDGQPIATDKIFVAVLPSHDPNMMLPAIPERTDCEVGEQDELEYTVHFQNTGEGETKYIEIRTYLDPRLDPDQVDAEVNWRGMSWCVNPYTSGTCVEKKVFPNDNLVVWYLHETTLMGTNQDACQDLEHTKGWINFKVKPRQSFTMGDDIVCHTEIVFDDNPPIRTDNAVVTCPKKDCGEQQPHHTPIWIWIALGIALVGLVVIITRRSRRSA